MDSSLLTVVFVVLCCASVNAVTVSTGVGDIVGIQSSYKNAFVNKFLGIPYAEPPTGDLRFRPPVPKRRFAAPYSADKSGAPCIQNPSVIKSVPHQNMSEDCLSLDVYVPAGGEAKKAVMVWIYGGAFVSGASFLYDATKMAAIGDVIVVTLNYRLGVFGFFTTGDANASGNYGLQDQQLALIWVKMNIGLQLDQESMENSSQPRQIAANRRRIEDQPLFRSVDFLLGSNRFEGSPFLEWYIGTYLLATGTSLYNGVPESAFNHIAQGLGGLNNSDSIKRLWNKYAKGKKAMPDARELLEFIGDSMFYRSIMKFANGHAASSTRSTYFYSFLHKPSRLISPLSVGVSIAPYVNGSIHGDELAFFFAPGYVWLSPGLTTAGEKKLSDVMIKYWTNFARSGNPNIPAAVPHQWPKYKVDQKKFIEFNIKNDQLDLRNSSSYRSQYMSYWDDIQPRLPSLCVAKPSAASSTSPSALLVAILIAAILKLIQ
ncbi:cocaine esterase-like [Lineus longissimus]|uniref:cocaine esterase-like n=1 Tax=Lineus longissimus TaxID=88925 RepID=UPI00315D9D69